MKVSAIYVYPIKSCRGVSLQSAELLSAGLRYDRKWCVVREDTGKCVTQREKSQLSQVFIGLPADLDAPDAALTVSAAGAQPLSVPLHSSTHNSDGFTPRAITVWDYKGSAVDEGDAAAAWFTALLGLPCRLVRYFGEDVAACEQGIKRYTDPEYAGGFETRFSDEFPMLLANEASLTDLNSKLPSAIPMNRFRPNIVVSGDEGAWAEDKWRLIAIQGPAGQELELLSVKPCARCKVPTIDQDTGVAGDEPTDTLTTFRSGKVLGWSEKDRRTTHAVFFGWNCVSKATGRISVGDTVTIKQYGEELSAPTAA